MTLPEYLNTLEKLGRLRKVSREVDPELEISEIVNRLYQTSKSQDEIPALLFEKVRGSSIPVAINLLGSTANIELVLGEAPDVLSAKWAGAAEEFKKRAPQGKALSWIWENLGLLKRALSARPKRTASAAFKEVVLKGPDIDLSKLPILKCWPNDGGRFITAGLVFTKSPVTGERNCGIYRLQVIGKNEICLHWQIQKGGGFHYAEAQRLGKNLEVAVVIGADPLLWLAGILPLPEGMDEIAFSGFLRGKSVETTPCETVGLEVPASSEIVIEGIAKHGRTALEGPFGDHFGHYSHPAPFPVLEIQALCRKKNPVYHAAVVGKPPQEDKAMGEAVSKIFLPLIKMIKPELNDLWAYFQAGFHNLLVASVKQRYEKEGLKTALGLLGEGQLSLSKCVILVDPDVDVRDFHAVLRALRKNFDPEQDFLLLPGTSQDTLDFTGLKLNRGSKMILDASSPAPSSHHLRGGNLEETSREARNLLLSQLKKVDPKILELTMLEDCLLVIKVDSGRDSEDCKDLLEKVLERSEVQKFKIAALVGEDVPLENETLLIWGIFTRFDCERDVLFPKAELRGSRPLFSGPMGIDATWKKGYPEPVEMAPEVIENVSRRWKEYGL